MEDHNRAEMGLGEVAGRGFDGKEMFEEMLEKALGEECTCSGESQDLLQAAERGCPRCCGKYVDLAGKLRDVWSNTTALMKAAEKGHLQLPCLLRPREAR